MTGLPSRSAPDDAPAQRPRTVIGVMGGMGPEASNRFGHELLQTDADCDQAHAPARIDQATQIPPMNGGTSPLPEMRASLHRLYKAGANVVVMASNSAHRYFDDVERSIKDSDLKLEPLHIVDATMEELARQKPGARKIGVLANSSTLDSKVYENRAAKKGHNVEWVYPQPQTQQRVMSGIADVKAGNIEQGKQNLLVAATELNGKGVDAILLASTEIPLALKTGAVQDATGAELPMIDSLASLAKAALHKTEATPSRLTTPAGSYSLLQEGVTRFVQSIATAVAGEPERARHIGVMGGMGPAAAMQFSDYMVKHNTAATADQQHVPMMVDQATDIPDRTKAILEAGRSPVDEMGKSLRRLAAAGMNDIVMTCNTAHYFFPQMQEIIERDKLDVKIVHIVDATMKLLEQQAPGAKKIGLLATSGTVQAGVYQDRVPGREWLVPNDATQTDKVMHGIYGGVKSGDFDTGATCLRQAAQELADNGADAILLACTEIPLVLKTGDIKNRDGKVIPLIDTLEAQAREAIERARVPVPATPGVVERVAAMFRPAHQAAHELAAQGR
jgi:aspartate racemase